MFIYLFIYFFTEKSTLSKLLQCILTNNLADIPFPQTRNTSFATEIGLANKDEKLVFVAIVNCKSSSIFFFKSVSRIKT